MIEKDFKKIISDWEANHTLRPQMFARFEETEALLQRTGCTVSFSKAYLVGAWAK